jgi:hypothetical protein
MDEERPCCAAAAARMIKKLVVNGREVGVAQLDEIIDRVIEAGPVNDDDIIRALMKELKIYNYVPYGMEPYYGAALLELYK